MLPVAPSSSRVSMDSRKLSSLPKGSAQHIYSRAEHRLFNMPVLFGSRAVANDLLLDCYPLLTSHKRKALDRRGALNRPLLIYLNMCGHALSNSISPKGAPNFSSTVCPVRL